MGLRLVFLVSLFFLSVTMLKANFVLSKEQEAELKKIDDLYGNYKTIKSKFIQKDNLNNRASGWFVIEKPGKARIEYDDIPVRFIAINNSLMFQDIKMKQKSFLPIKGSPFSYLLEEKTSFFSNKIKIISFSSKDEYVEIGLISTEYPEVGSLTLFLAKETADIIKWVVIDSRGIQTEIFLISPVFSNQPIKTSTIFNTQRIKEFQFSEVN